LRAVPRHAEIDTSAVDVPVPRDCRAYEVGVEQLHLTSRERVRQDCTPGRVK